MKSNPPIKGHALLREGEYLDRYNYLGEHEPIYGCECGRRPIARLGRNATKRWHRQHKAELRESVAS